MYAFAVYSGGSGHFLPSVVAASTTYRLGEIVTVFLVNFLLEQETNWFVEVFAVYITERQVQHQRQYLCYEFIWFLVE